MDSFYLVIHNGKDNDSCTSVDFCNDIMENACSVIKYLLSLVIASMGHYSCKYKCIKLSLQCNYVNIELVAANIHVLQ